MKSEQRRLKPPRDLSVHLRLFLPAWLLASRSCMCGLQPFGLALHFLFPPQAFTPSLQQLAHPQARV